MVDEPPVPGMSKAMIWRFGIASMSGRHISMLAPMPLIKSNGGPSPLTLTRIRC